MHDLSSASQRLLDGENRVPVGTAGKDRTT